LVEEHEGHKAKLHRHALPGFGIKVY
jgi:hypothetical protein